MIRRFDLNTNEALGNFELGLAEPCHAFDQSVIASEAKQSMRKDCFVALRAPRNDRIISRPMPLLFAGRW